MLPPDQIVSLLKFEGLIEELEKKDDFKSRIKITLQAIEDALPDNIKCEQKDSIQSAKFKEQADKLCYKKRDRMDAIIEAWELYSKSIAKAEKSSKVLAQSYGNRSSTLFNLSKYTECITDIDRALELGYPDHLRANLLRRKAKCLKLLGNLEADKVCEEARLMLENISLDEDKKGKLKAKFMRTTKFLESQESKEKNNVLQEVTRAPDILFHPHDHIPSASNSVNLKFTKEFGRHLVANRNISAGEILIIEKPYASLLSKENIFTHCSHCFVRAWASIPCDHCVHVLYCSEDCRNKAWEQYHDIECPLKGYLMTLQTNDWVLLSLRLTILAAREYGSIKKLKMKLKEIEKCEDYLMKSVSEDGIYHSDQYRSFYNLKTHERNRNRNEILMLSLNSAFVLYFMFQSTSFFGETSDKSISNLSKNEDAMFFGKLLAHNYMIIHTNHHEFSELRNYEHYRVGSVIGSVSSLLNHSCHPNTGRCPVLKNNTIQQVFHALHPIKKGSQIFDDYGCNFGFVSKKKREEFIKPFYFKCNCIACNEMWPLFEELPSMLSLVTDKEMKVEVSRAIVRSKKYQRIIFHTGLHKYPEDKGDILVSLARSVTILSESTSKPTKEYAELLELFRQAFVHIHGNKFELHCLMHKFSGND